MDHEELETEIQTVKKVLYGNGELGVVGKTKLFNKHIKEGSSWRKVIISTIIMGVTQIICFAYMYGGLTETVRQVNADVIVLKTACVDTQRHIIQDEARWDVFKLSDKIN